MSIQVVCSNPDCGAPIGLPPSAGGAGGRCPHCGWLHLGIDTPESAGTSGHSARVKTDWGDQKLFQEGAIFDGRYRIERPLGAGGMGVVFRAFDLKLERRVALKIPHFDAHFHPDLVKRFQREARIAAAFDHPNLCPVFDFNRAGQFYYLTMPFIEGRPLSTLLEFGPIPPPQAAAIVRTLALALEEAHGRGVIHRDLKPANIMVSRAGKLIVMDFGIARLATATDSLRTRPGTLLGTPAYMAPEQVEGQGHAIGAATDVYCLGVIYYQLLTGRLPFEGNPNLVCVQVVHEDPPSPIVLRPDLDPGLVAVCLKAMKKRPADRYASMAEMAAALDSARTRSVGRREPVVSSAPPAPDLPQTVLPTWCGLSLGAAPTVRRKAPMREALVLTLLLVLGGLLWVGYRVESAPQSPPPLSPSPTSPRPRPRRALVSPARPAPAPAPHAVARHMEPLAGRETGAEKREPSPAEPEPLARPEPPLEMAKHDPVTALDRLRAELRDGYRESCPDRPDENLQRLWNEVHEIQAGLDEPVTTIVIKVRKSKSNVPLVLYCDDRRERHRERKLYPGTVEVLAPVMPVTLTYVLHVPHPGGNGPHPSGGREPYDGVPPFLGAFPPPHPGSPLAALGPHPVPARRIDLKNRELVIEFEYSQATARWKHHLHLASPVPAGGVG